MPATLEAIADEDVVDALVDERDLCGLRVVAEEIDEDAVQPRRRAAPDRAREVRAEGGELGQRGANLVSATGAAPEIIAGMPRARALGALGVPTLKGLPKIEVVLVASNAAAGGVSGLGALVLAAAVGNAIFAATGMRLRRLPFDPMSAG